MSNWFYIRQWHLKKISYIGKELTYPNANSLFKSLTCVGAENRSYLLISKDNLWKVVYSDEDIGDWVVVSANCISG